MLVAPRGPDLPGLLHRSSQGSTYDRNPPEATPTCLIQGLQPLTELLPVQIICPLSFTPSVGFPKTQAMINVAIP